MHSSLIKLISKFTLFSVSLVILMSSACTKSKPPSESASDILIETTASRDGFTASVNNDSVGLSWAGEASAQYMIIQTTGSVAIVPPELDILVYQLGQVFGNNKVIYLGNNAQTLAVNSLAVGSVYLFSLYLVESPGHYKLVSTLEVTAGVGVRAVGAVGSAGGSTVGSSGPRLKRPSSFSINTDNTGLSLSWAAGGGQTGFLLVRSTNAITFKPVKGQSYTVGDDLGNDQSVIYIGSDLSFADYGLENGTKYYYSLFAFNSTYAYSDGYQNQRTPQKNVLHLPTISALPSDGTNTLSWTKGNSNPTGVVLFRRVVKDPNSPTIAINSSKVYQLGDLSANGQHAVIYRGNANSFADTGLTNDVTQYYTLFLYYADGKLGKYSAGVAATPFSLTVSIRPPPSKSTALSTKCKVHAGQPFPWEGSGICTGNLMTSVPLLGTPLSLIHNSNDASSNYGFGHGFRLSVDRRIKIQSATDLVIESGDGSPMAFTNTSGSWVSTNLSLNRNSLSVTSTSATETTRMGVIYTYTLLTAVEGGSVQYGLTKITYPNKQFTTITRASGGYIQSIKDNFNNEITFQLSGGKVSSIENTGGYDYSLQYSPNLTQLTYGAGSETVTWRFGYDSYASDLINSVTDTIGGETRVEYSGTVDPLGAMSLASLTDPLGYKTTFKYGDKTVTTENFQGKLKENFNDSGQLISNDSIKIKETFTRNSLGQVESHTDHFGVKTTYTYGTNAWLSGISSTAGPTITFDRVDGDITKKTIQGPAGSTVTTYGYVQHRLTSITGPGSYTASFTYDNFGNLTESRENGRVVRSVAYFGNGLPKNISLENGTKSYGYDFTASGQLREVSTPVGKYTLTYGSSQNFGFLPTKISGPGLDLDTTYDGMGRETITSLGGGNKAAYKITKQYSGPVTTTSDHYQSVKNTESHNLQEVEVSTTAKDWLLSAMVTFHRVFSRGD